MDRKKLENVLPVLNKYSNSAVVLMWKLGLGKFFNIFPAAFGKTIVVDFSRHEAKTPTQIPLVYYSQGDVLYCTALWNTQPDWYLNVMTNPQVEVWLPEGWYAAIAELVEDEEERTQIMPLLFQNAGAVLSFCKKMSRIDPTEGEEADIPVLRIKRQSPCTGVDGPGSLAWLWPLITMLLLFKCRRKRK